MTSGMKASAPQRRVYTSKTPQRQLPLKQQKPKNRCQHAVFATRPFTRQETLTQIGFVSSPRSLEDYDKDVDAYENGTRESKRRKLGDFAIDSTYHTQTLTQLAFTSTPQLNVGIEDKENLGTGVHRQNRHHRRLSTEEVPLEDYSCSKLTSSPRTPRRSNITEIPSSQSPVTPLSCQRNERPSSANYDDVNSEDLLRRSPSRSATKPLSRLKVEDTFDDDSQRTLQTRFSSPIPGSSPSRQPEFIKRTVFTKSLCHTNQLLASDTTQEIEDSEAGSTDGDECDGADADPLQTSPSTATKASAEMTTLRDEKSQDSEDEAQFERLSTQILASMAPRSNRSDVFISVHPNDLNGIVCGRTRNVFRNHPLPIEVKRIWLYETSPASKLSHMACIAEGTCPQGQSTMILTRKEGQTFDERGRYPYKLQQIYRLADPITLADLKLRQWLRGPPQTHIYVPPAVLDALMANLERLIPTTSESSPTESQEAEAQLQNNILQFSDPADEAETTTQSVSQRRSPDVLDISDDSLCMLVCDAQMLRSSQATTMDLSQTSNMLKATSMIASLTTDRSCPAIGQGQSPTLSNGKSPLARQEMSRSMLPDSSQILTRSQMLPDSLLNDSVPLPRLYVDDSQEEV